MAGNHKQYSYSVKNLLFCPKMTAMKQGKPFSNSFGYNSERRLSQPNSLRKSIQAGGSVNLPPVEHSSHRSRRKHCNALDLLQLMKDCEQARSPSKANCSSHYCNYSGGKSTVPDGQLPSPGTSVDEIQTHMLLVVILFNAALLPRF